MDEIIIEDKKYISSKRAAEITGYAKDYVGQLCREGRVESRLVGRSWYVREAAIKDHRFGAKNSPIVPELTSEYKSTGIEVNGSVVANSDGEAETRISDPVFEEGKSLRRDDLDNQSEAVATHEQMQAAWQEWFTRSKEASVPRTPLEPVLTEEPAPIKVEENMPEQTETDIAVAITRIAEESSPILEEKSPDPVIVPVRGTYFTLRLGLIAVATVVSLYTLLSLGFYTIPYVDQNSTANFILGTKIYSK